MTPEEHIAYWKKCSDEAKTKGAALVAFGVYAGLKMAAEQLVSSPTGLTRAALDKDEGK